MNFDEIKRNMDAQHMDDKDIPESIREIKNSNMPIQKIRISMRSEIIVQLLIIVLFFIAPSIIKMHELPKGLYYILMFITSLITLGYLVKMKWFLKRSNHLGKNSKDTIITVIHDLKLTLEVYKTAVISGSLLLPLSVLALFLGSVKLNEEVFTNLILLKLPNTTLILYTLGYVILALIIYYTTVLWSDKLYGVHVKHLENMLKEFDA